MPRRCRQASHMREHTCNARQYFRHKPQNAHGPHGPPGVAGRPPLHAPEHTTAGHHTRGGEGGPRLANPLRQDGTPTLRASVHAALVAASPRSCHSFLRGAVVNHGPKPEVSLACEWNISHRCR